MERHVFVRLDDFFHHAAALLFRKEVLFVRVYRDDDIDFIEELARSFYNA